MNDKEKIRAKIEYRIGVCNIVVETQENELDKALFVGKVLAYEDVLSLINSLPEEPTPKGYDEAYLNECIAKASKTWKGVDVDKFMDEVRGRESDDLEEAAEEYALNVDAGPYYNSIAMYGFMAGAVWQKKRFEAEYELDWITDLKKDLYELGRKDEREQMMKDVVDGQIYGCDGAHWVEAEIDERITGKEGDKVKIIILKDDENIND